MNFKFKVSNFLESTNSNHSAFKDSINCNQESLTKTYTINLDADYIKDYAKNNEIRLETLLNRFTPDNSLDARDYKFVLDFSEDVIKQLQDTESIKWNQTVKWLGKMFFRVVSNSFQLLTQGQLTYDETKVHLCQNIIINIINLFQKKKLSDKQKGKFGAFINQTSIEIIDFLLTKYPQTKLGNPNKLLETAVKPINNLASIENDMLLSSGIVFNLKQDSDYTQQIMKLINHIILLPSRQIEGVQQTHEEYFNKFFNQLFQSMYEPTHLDKSQLSEKQYERAREIYREKQKKTSYYKIGRKLDKHFPLFTQDEIASENFIIKGQVIIRIMTKWLQNLSQIIENPEKNIVDKNTRFKGSDGSAKKIHVNYRKLLAKMFIKNSKLWKKQINELINHCNAMLEIIVHKLYDLSNLDFLDEKEIEVGDFSCKLESISSQYLLHALNKSIYCIEKTVQQTKQKLIEKGDPSQTQKIVNMLNVELVQFKIGDLLRCKCVSSQKNIIRIYNRLVEDCSNQSSKMEIMRIKNRLSKGTRDILINILLNKQILCQVQLGIQTGMDEKQSYYDQFNHILYETKRARFGPIIQAASIWCNYDQRALSFKKQLSIYQRKTIKNHNKPIKHECPKDSLKPEIFPFICSSCNLLINSNRYLFKKQSCSQCQLKICGKCLNLTFTFQDRIKLIFGEQISQFLPYISQYTEEMLKYTNQKDFPSYGIFVKKNQSQKSIIYFKKLLERVIDSFDVMIALDQSQSSQNTESIQQSYVISFVEFKYNQQFNLLRSQKQTGQIIYQINDNFQLQMRQILNENFVFFFHKKQSPQQILNLRNLSKVNIKKMSKILLKKNKKRQKQIDKILTKNRQKFCVVDLKDEGRTVLFPLYKIQQIWNKKLEIEARNTINRIIQEESIAITVDNPYLLKEIHLSSNLKALGKIKEVSCYQNDGDILIKEQDLIAVSKLENLIYCELYELQVSESAFLKNLLHLQTLSMIATKSTDESIKVLTSLKNLMKINLSNNDLTSLSIFNQFQNLQQLEITQNKIQVIFPLDLPSLKKLYLDSNLIHKLQNFQKIGKLTVLSLGSNAIKKIENLDPLNELRHLNLSLNHIHSIQNLQQLKWLEVLDISWNPIHQIKRQITELSHLKTLKIKKHEFKEICQIDVAENVVSILNMLKYQEVKLVLTKLQFGLKMSENNQKQRVQEIHKVAKILNSQLGILQQTAQEELANILKNQLLKQQ